MERYIAKSQEEILAEKTNAEKLTQENQNYIMNAAQFDIEVKPSEELAKFDHYNSITSVTVSDDIKKFWESQQNALGEIDTITPQNEFMNAFKEHENIDETICKLERSQIGTNSFEEQKKSARDQIQEAKANLSKARKSRKEIHNQVSPEQVFFGKLLGNSKDFDAYVEAILKSVPKAKKSLKKAENNLTNIENNENIYYEKLANLHVEQTMATRKMENALEKIKENQNIANKIDLNSKKVSVKLEEQYNTINTYLAIQELKKQPNYNSIYEILKNNPENGAIINVLDSIPESIPQNTFEITLNGPIQIRQNPKQLAEVKEKLTKTNKALYEKKSEKSDIETQLADLPNKIKELSDLDEKRKNFELKDSDTIESLTQQQEGLDQDSEEYKNIAIKIKHLELKQEVKKYEDSLNMLKEEERTTTDPKRKDELEQIILKKKIYLSEVLKDDLKNDEYSQTLQTINAEYSKKDQEIIEIKKLEQQKNALKVKIQKLEAEKKKFEHQKNTFETQKNLQNIDISIIEKSLYQNEELIPFCNGQIPISHYFKKLLADLKTEREISIKQKSIDYQKLPAEKNIELNELDNYNENDEHNKNENNNHDEHDDDEGR